MSTNYPVAQNRDHDGMNMQIRHKAPDEILLLFKINQNFYKDASENRDAHRLILNVNLKNEIHSQSSVLYKVVHGTSAVQTLIIVKLISQYHSFSLNTKLRILSVIDVTVPL